MRALLRSLATLPLACLFSTAMFTLAAAPVEAQSVQAVAASARITAPLGSGAPVMLAHHVPDYASFGVLPSVALNPAGNLNGLVLMLSRAPQVEAAWQQLLADQQDPASPRYHQWLTPQQVGALYGPAQSDVDAAVNWLQSQGLTVSEVSPSRVAISFGGSVQQVSSAFRTSFRTYSLANGETRFSIAQDPSVPSDMAPIVRGIAGLSQVIHRPTMRRGELVAPRPSGSLAQPEYTSTTSGKHYMLSSDFNSVFGVNNAATAGYNGHGQRIAVVGLSRVNALDVSRLQTLAGAAVDQPNVIIPPTGVDPGTPGDSNPSQDSGAQDEATLDIGRTTGTAPGATIDLIVSGNVGAGNTIGTDGLYIAINYNINTQMDPIMSISFGGCEALNGQSITNYEDSIFQVAASEGISTFVSSGDSSAAACNAFSSTIPTTQQLSINDICASGSVTCVGGTEFADSANPGLYWNSTNSATNGSSIISYIPEGAWNDVTAPSGTTTTYSYGGSGGGTSIYIARPSWQTGVGVLSGTYRLVPDVADPSSTHDGFVGCLNYAGGTCTGSSASFSNFYSFGGTSAAAPTMAATQAIANQKLNGKQGNINAKLYQLAATPSNNVFHDATPATSAVSNCVITTPSLCNNSTPTSTSLTGGLNGYLLTTGWDAVTGWGTLDVNNYITALGGLSTTIAVTASPNPIAVGALDRITATLTPSAGTPAATGTVQFYSNGAAIGSAVSLSSNTATLSYAFPSSGTYLITATYSGDSTFATSTSGQYSLTVSTNTAFTVNATAPKTLSLISGATTGNSIPVVIKADSTFSGTVTLSCTANGSTPPGTCTLSAPSVTLAAGASQTVTATIGSTAGTSGNLSFTVSGSNGILTQSDLIGATLTASSLTVAGATNGYLTVAAGATANNTEAVTITSVNGFAGTAALSCAFGAPVGSGLTSSNTSCTISPTTVTLTANGTAPATVTFVTTANTNGSASMTVTATGTTSGATLSTTGTVGLGLTVIAPAITVTPTSGTISFAGNSTTGLTDAVTLTASNGFSGSATLACSTGVATPATCSISPSTVNFAVNGTAMATITFAPVQHASGSVTATITATGGVTVGSTTVMATVAKVNDTITAVSATPTATIGASDTLTATVTPASNNGAATGTVTFYNGSTSIGTGTVGAGGVATLAYTPGSSQALALSAQYAGDSGYNASSSTTTTVNIATYALAPSAGSLSFVSGATTGNTDTITATSSNGFAGSVNLTCTVNISSGSPASPATCAINPASLTLTANGTASATVTLTTITAHARSGAQAANRTPAFNGLKAGGALFALLLCAVPFRRRRPVLSRLAVLLVLAGGLAAMTGCGGGGSAPTPLSSSAGTYTVNVQGTSSSTGTVAISTSFSLVVN